MGVSALELRRRVLMAQPHKERKTGGIVSFNTHVPQVLDVSVPLSPVQAGTGDPYPPGGGKNKIKYPYASQAGTFKGVSVTVNDDGTLVFNGTATAAIYFNLVATNAGIPMEAGDYILHKLAQTVPTGVNITAAKNGSYWKSATTENLSLSLTESANIAWYIRVESGTTLSNFSAFPMFEKGTTASEWTPYSNIRPISGHTGAAVCRTGKNLLPQTNYKENRFSVAEDGTISQLDESSASWAWAYTNSIFRTTLPPGTYSVTETLLDNVSTSSHGVQVIAEDGTIIRNIVSGAKPAGEYSQSFTISKTTNIGVAIKCYSAKAKLSIVAGATASEYAPFSGESFPFTFPDTVYGGRLEPAAGRVVVEYAVKSVRDFGRWYEFNSPYPALRTRWLPLNSNKSSLKCSHYKSVVAGSTSPGHIIAGSWYYNLAICDPDNFTTQSELLAYADEQEQAGNPIQIYVPLAEPLIIPLTPAEIRALMGENNVFADTGDVDVEFWTN